MGRPVRRLLTRLVLVAVIAWCGACAFLFFAQRSLLYFPAMTRVAAVTTDYALQRPGAVLRGWVVNPGHADALLYFGGNAEAIEANRELLARAIPDRTIYFVAYRGYGASDGEPTEAALFEDALALYDDVRRTHASVAAIGRSLGSGVATWLASQRPLERIALVTPYDSIVRIAQSAYPLFPVKWLMRDRYESARNAVEVHCPVWVLQAGDDEVIPADSTRRLAEAFRPTPRVTLVAGATHNDIQSYPEFAAGLHAFFAVSGNAAP